jgi:cobalamin transport system substrate-binding protein
MAARAQALALAAVLCLALQDRSAAAAPARIVSLIPAITEMLFAIGAGPQVVGVGSFDTFPPEIAGLPRVGALLDPNLERILALKPDLVAVYASQTDLREQLARATIPTFVYAHAGLADVTPMIRKVGAAAGRDREANAVAARIESRLGELRALTARQPRPRTVVVFGRETGALRGIYASGGVGFVHDMLAAAGGDNVFADVERQAVQATTELILARKPDVILELRASLKPSEAGREARVWRALPSVPAVKSGRVYVLTDARTVVPGPRIAEGVELIARVLHPAVFK